MNRCKMKYILVVPLLAAIACSGQPSEERVVGSWYACNDVGSYKEMHFQPNYFRSAIGENGKFLADFLFFYHINNDTLYYSDSPLRRLGNDHMRKSYIRLIDRGTLLMQSATEVDTLYRLNMIYTPQPADNSVEVASKWYSTFEEGFSNRMAQAACTNQTLLQKGQIDTLDAGLDSINFDIDNLIEGYEKP